jgi:hypothetical protein
VNVFHVILKLYKKTFRKHIIIILLLLIYRGEGDEGEWWRG